MSVTLTSDSVYFTAEKSASALPYTDQNDVEILKRKLAHAEKNVLANSSMILKLQQYVAALDCSQGPPGRAGPTLSLVPGFKLLVSGFKLLVSVLPPERWHRQSVSTLLLWCGFFFHIRVLHRYAGSSCFHAKTKT